MDLYLSCQISLESQCICLSIDALFVIVSLGMYMYRVSKLGAMSEMKSCKDRSECKKMVFHVSKYI